MHLVLLMMKQVHRVSRFGSFAAHALTTPFCARFARTTHAIIGGSQRKAQDRGAEVAETINISLMSIANEHQTPIVSC